MNGPRDTIAALATPPGEGGVAILRMSGPTALAVADAVFRCPPPHPSAREPFTFVHGHVVDADGQPIDDGLLLIFRAPRSYTGEDAVELQVHGGSVNARRILRRLLAAGARAAEPGEFTKRAFLNGRLDLLQAEAVADLIHARSERAAVAASQQLEGRLSQSFNSLYDQILGHAAHLEATLDFPEDELPATILHGIREKIRASLHEITSLLASWEQGHLLRDGARVVIAGRPNVGKSTLLNALAGKDRAIVSNIPGTTRDVLEEGIVIDGIPLVIVDTAGLRDALCEVEQEGIRRTARQVEQADVHLVVTDGSVPLHEDEIQRIRSLPAERTVVILNKSDLGQAPFPTDLGARRTLRTALREGKGLDQLRQALRDILEGGLDTSASQGAVISERHRSLLDRARVHTGEALRLLDAETPDAPTLAADELRAALERLGEVTGRIYHDELLAGIFSRFCIGK